MSFQGKQVQNTKIALTGGAQEVFDDVPEIDQIVSVTIDGRVTGIDHRVNERTGDLEQFVRIKVIDVAHIKTQTFPRMVSVSTDVDPQTGERAAQ